jgi:hypothetical protein
MQSDRDSRADAHSLCAAYLALPICSPSAAVFGVPVFISLNLSTAPATLTADGITGGGTEQPVFVERTLIKELRACQKHGMFVK